MKKLVVAALMATVAPPAMAQAPLPDADPAMWVVKDEDTTIYLFGTFHMLDGKRDWFNDEVRTAFDSSDELVLEAILPENPAEMQPLIAKYAVDPEGKTLNQKLTPEVKAKLDKKLGDFGLPPQAFEAFEPWFVSISLSTFGAQKLGLTPEHGPETILTQAAKKKGLPIAELEGMERQLALLDTLPEDAQVKAIGQTLDQMDKLEETFTPMLTAWSTGDTDTLVKMMNEAAAEENRAFYDLMFPRRNANWAEWIDTRLDKPGTVFVAVGAGHLAGNDSVQALLEKRGIKSLRVTAAAAAPAVYPPCRSRSDDRCTQSR